MKNFHFPRPGANYDDASVALRLPLSCIIMALSVLQASGAKSSESPSFTGIQDPHTWSVRTEFEAIDSIQALVAQGNHIYAFGHQAQAQKGEFQIIAINASDPNNLKLVDTLTIMPEGDFSGDIWLPEILDPNTQPVVVNDKIYLLTDLRYGADDHEGVLHALDISDPTSLQTPPKINIGVKPRDFTAIGDFVYTIRIPTHLAPSTISVVEFNGSEPPAIVGSYEFYARSTACFVADEPLLFLGQNGEIIVLDASDPQNPIVLSSIPLEGEVQDIFVNDQKAYIACNRGIGPGIVHVMDFTDTGNIHVIHSTPLDPNKGPDEYYFFSQIIRSENALYVVGDEHGYNVLDFTNPEAPTLLFSRRHYPFNSDNTVALANDLIFTHKFQSGSVLLLRPPAAAAARLFINGPAGTDTTVMRSSDAVHWSEWQSLTTTGDTLELLDEEFPPEGRMFYKLNSP